jgi:two-component system, LytTR family, response regulator
VISYRVFIVDDNQLITKKIKQLVEQTGEFEIVGEANCVDSFRQLFPTLKLDLVILDIDLPDGNGMELAKWIRGLEPELPLLFITGYADYGAESYQVEATDYILKPIDQERVKKALDKVKKQINQADPNWERIEKAIISQGKIAIKQEQGLALLDTASIVLIQKEGKKTLILTLEENEEGKREIKKYYTNENLKDIHMRVDSSSFIRSHHSFIIQLRWVKEVVRYSTEAYKIKFKYTEEYALLNRDKLNTLIQQIQ